MHRRTVALICLSSSFVLIMACVGAFVIYQRLFIIKIYSMPSESMEPTIMGHDKGYNLSTNMNHSEDVHDHILVDRTAYKWKLPARGDIIAFKAEKKADKAA